MIPVLSGICRTCGNELVQTHERTYHPAVIAASMDTPCSALLLIDDRFPDLGLSFDVPDVEFIHDGRYPND